MQTAKIRSVGVIICASCKNYRKKRTDYMETFYHCALDDEEVIISCIKEVKGSTPRINKVMLQGKCPTFERKRG
ncbi:MAG: hypothetical protein AAB818_02260 [Patescibacteria group bacterium]